MNSRMTSIPIVLALYTILICIPSSVYAKKEVRQQIQLKAGAALQRVNSIQKPLSVHDGIGTGGQSAAFTI